jgi:hypothetical protein
MSSGAPAVEHERVALVFANEVMIFESRADAEEYLTAMFGHMEAAFNDTTWSIKPIVEP